MFLNVFAAGEVRKYDLKSGAGPILFDLTIASLRKASRAVSLGS
jgi:hypothetical protein